MDEVQTNNSLIQPQSPILPISTPTPNPPSINWIKFFLLILFVLIVIIGSIFIGIQIGKNQTLNRQPTTIQPSASPIQITVNPTVQPILSPTTNPTTDWQLYSNDKYGISFKYPSDYKVTLLSGAINLQKNSTRALLYLSEFNNPNSLDILQWFNNQPKEDIQPIKDTHNMTETIVGGQKALKFTKTQPETGYKDFLIVVGNKFNVYYLYFGPKDNEVSITNQILSTFKFTN